MAPGHRDGSHLNLRDDHALTNSVLPGHFSPSVFAQETLRALGVLCWDPREKDQNSVSRWPRTGQLTHDP